MRLREKKTTRAKVPRVVAPTMPRSHHGWKRRQKLRAMTEPVIRGMPRRRHGQMEGKMSCSANQSTPV